jgi:hypothetical protein
MDFLQSGFESGWRQNFEICYKLSYICEPPDKKLKGSAETVIQKKVLTNMIFNFR